MLAELVRTVPVKLLQSFLFQPPIWIQLNMTSRVRDLCLDEEVGEEEEEEEENPKAISPLYTYHLTPQINGEECNRRKNETIRCRKRKELRLYSEKSCR